MSKPSPSPELPKLGDFLCFAVYSANLAYGRAYKPILDELGVTYTQWITIVALWEQDEQTVSSLGDKLFLESNTLTPILKKLEALGYLERRRDAKDERQVIVKLTAAGRAPHHERGARQPHRARAAAGPVASSQAAPSRGQPYRPISGTKETPPRISRS